MTQFDIDTIEKWRHSFGNKNEPIGVQEDIWDRVEWLKANGYDHFPHVQAVMGRRASKGMIGGILGAERLAHLISLDNPQEHYGVAEGKDIFLHVVATSLGQAKKFQFADIRQTVEQNPWFEPFVSYSGDTAINLMTAADKRRILSLEARGLPVSREIATVRAVAMASTAKSGRGGTAFMNQFDEFAHAMTTSGSQMSSEEIYCLVPDTKIRMASEALKSLSDVNIGDFVKGVSESNPSVLLDAKVVNKWIYPKSKTFTILLDDGTKIRCTARHRWLTSRGWVRTDELTDDDEIMEASDFE